MTPQQVARFTLDELKNGSPISEWLVCGPFVVHTSGAFEQEYMYDRERILRIDYLEADGGEAAVRPAPGLSHPNPGIGPKRLSWSVVHDSWLRLTGMTGEALYETVQRNAIWYAAATLVSPCRQMALIRADHTGARLWVNGRLAMEQAYGIAKGLRISHPPVPVVLEQGENLILFKVRPGYIADGVNYHLGDVQVWPVAAAEGCPLGIACLQATPHFTGTLENPAQLLELVAVNVSSEASPEADLILRCDELSWQSKGTVGALKPGETCTVRIPTAAPRDRAGQCVTVSLSAAAGGSECPLLQAEVQLGSAPEKAATMYVGTDFHFDTTYHEEQRVYAMGAFDIVRRYVELHRLDPNFKSTLSEVDYLKPYFDTYPEDRETLLRVFREGRSEPDVMYNQPNEQSIGGEALVRNFLYGQLFHQRVLGRKCYIYNPGDVFGHPNQLSQICAKSGCIGVAWYKHIIGFPPLFWHVSPDGTKLIHHHSRPSRKETEMLGLTAYWGSADQTPPTDWTKNLLHPVKFAVWSDYFRHVEEDLRQGHAHLPITSRDMSLYHAGTALSRTNLKIANRLTENVLLTAERFATIASLFGARYPDRTIDKAWRQLLCGQHHDSITGTHNEISYIDLMNSYREALELATDACRKSTRALASLVDAPQARRNDTTVVVFNALNWRRTDVCRVRLQGVDPESNYAAIDPDGASTPCQVVSVSEDGSTVELAFVARDIPSVGYKTFAIRKRRGKARAKKETKDSRARIANKFYRVDVDPARGGGIVSIFDKQSKREVIDVKRNGRLGNEIAVLQEVPDRSETQHEMYTTGLKLFSSERPATVTVERGPVFSRIRVEGDLAEICGYRQEILLWEDVKRIDFRTMLLDYQREDDLFAVVFPTSLKDAVPVFDERYAAVVRNESRNLLDFRTHQTFMFSDCAVYSANKWLDYSSNDHIAICDGQGNQARRMSIGMIGAVTPHDPEQRQIAYDMAEALIGRGIPVTPWFDSDELVYGTMPPDMNEDLLYTGMRVSIGVDGQNRYTEKLLDTLDETVRAAIKQRVTENGYAFLLVEDKDLPDGWKSLPVLLIIGKDVQQTRNAAKSFFESIRNDGRFELTEDEAALAEAPATSEPPYGVALINNGTIANSVERGGTLCVLLCHTARWYGGTQNFPEGYLVPEQKNHVFVYSLYPHEGTWREAETDVVGYEVNYPLLPVIADETAGKLPAEQSFLRTDGRGVILTAMKPFGNPIAAFQADRTSRPEEGIMLRFYETQGRTQPLRVSFFAGVQSAWRANLLEEKEGDLNVGADGVLSVDVPTFSIETYGFVPAEMAPKLIEADLDLKREPVTPTYVRSWEHDAESMPLGYEPVVASISRKIDVLEEGKRFRIRIGFVNDLVDGPARIDAQVWVGDGWTVEPGELSCEIGPLGSAVREVIVTAPEKGAVGQVKLRYTWEDQAYQDLLEINGSSDLQLEVRRENSKIIAVVSNPTAQPIEGEVSLVTPIETWPTALVGDYSLLDISPRTHGVSVPPGGTVETTFDVKPIVPRSETRGDSYWAVIKMMSNGRITMKRCDVHGERRLWNSHKMWEVVRKRREEFLRKKA